MNVRLTRPGSRKGPLPTPPDPTPAAREPVNLTDGDSRILRKSSRSEYQQACNAQAALPVGVCADALPGYMEHIGRG